MSSVIVYTQSSWLLHCKLLCRSSVSELPARGVASCNRRATADMDGGLPPEGCAAVLDPSNRPASPGFCERLSSACVMIRCPGVAASGVPGVPVPLRPPPAERHRAISLKFAQVHACKFCTLCRAWTCPSSRCAWQQTIMATHILL